MINVSNKWANFAGRGSGNTLSAENGAACVALKWVNHGSDVTPTVNIQLCKLQYKRKK
jgi:hypothetical protein